jgi:hypothetical protein
MKRNLFGEVWENRLRPKPSEWRKWAGNVGTHLMAGVIGATIAYILLMAGK